MPTVLLGNTDAKEGYRKTLNRGITDEEIRRLAEEHPDVAGYMVPPMDELRARLEVVIGPLPDGNDATVIALAKAHPEVQDTDPANMDVLASRLESVVWHRPLEGKRITRVNLPDENDPMSWVADICAKGRGIWDNHSAGAPPAWVETDNEFLALAISQRYGCPIGRPDDWDEPTAGGSAPEPKKKGGAR